MSHNPLNKKISQGFKLPNDYLNTVEDRLSHRLQNLPLIATKASGFKVPEGYLDNFKPVVSKQHKTKAPKTVKLTPLRKFIYLSGVAASVVLALSYFSNQNNNHSFNKLDTTVIETYLQDDFNLQYVSTLFQEDDLDLSAFSQVNFSNESFENYIIDNATIDDLIDN